MVMICINRADGGVSIGPIADHTTVEKQVVKWEKWAALSHAHWLTPEGTAVGFRAIMPDDIEANTGGLKTPQVFINAWIDDGTRIVHDMAKARAIRTNQVRTERNARLDAEDVELKKAEDGNDQAAAARVRAKRQALRDLPATIQPDLDAITTPEALEAFEPAWPA